MPKLSVVVAAFFVVSSCAASPHVWPKPRSVPQRASKCSIGWYHLRGGGDLCYTVGNTYGWWTIARAKCQSYGGDLASITNEELNEEIAAWTGAMFLGVGFWIGLTSNDSGELVWTDGSPVNYTNWADDYPNGYTDLITYMGYDGKWRDDEVEDVFAYICEKAPEK